jgi:rhodanese-related sulfurtransferase
MMNKPTPIPAPAFADAISGSLKPFFIDVRTPVEFSAGHVLGAHLYPLQGFQPKQVLKQAAVEFGKGAPIYVLCKGGARAQKAAEQLAEHTDQPIYVVEGGTDACVALDMAIHRNEKAPISLDRQVRITAGSLVLLGVILGGFIHPIWFGLSGFVGAGLLFSGVTDTCGMAMLLSRMPWNKTGG